MVPGETMKVYEQIRHAILNKFIVVAWYDGLRREMCPHVLGTHEGRQRALFYQFGGSSKRGLGPPGDPDNWRYMDIDNLSSVSIHDGVWRTAPNYRGITESIREHIDWIDVQAS
jgi:hypothetical protein